MSAAPVVVEATAVPVPTQQAMTVVVPDGVTGGAPFMIQVPGGGMMQVTCPPQSTAGEQIQVMVPASAMMPVAMPGAGATPVGAPMMGAPMMGAGVQMMPTTVQPMMAALGVGGSHPAAYGMDGQFPDPQSSSVAPPQPIRKKQPGGKSYPAPPDGFKAGFQTGSPHNTVAFFAPHSEGVMSEVDFDASLLTARINDSVDPFGAWLSGGVELALDLDVEGRVEEAVSNRKKNCYSYLACCVLCPPCGPCMIGCRALCGSENGDCQPLQGGCGENEKTEQLRVQASAHKLALHSDCLVYERAAYTTRIVRNYTASDQYGHKFAACAEAEAQIPAGKLSIPLGRASVSLVKKSSVVRLPVMSDANFAGCCDYTPQGDIVAVSVGDGLKVVVACVEVGTGSNAAAFVEACRSAKGRAPAEPPDLAAAYSSWLVGRLQQTGTMAGCAPRGQAMERSTAARQFVKTIGPIPEQLGIERNWLQLNKINGVGIAVNKAGLIFEPKAHSPFADQLNAGDALHSINGVPRTRLCDHAYLNAVEEAGQKLPPGQPRYLTAISTMPYFQPNYLVSVALPSGAALASIGLESNAAAPPKVGPAASSFAASLGLLPNDVIVQAVVNGAPVDTTSMTVADLMAIASAAPGAVQLTVLQNSRVASLSHAHSWPSGKPAY